MSNASEKGLYRLQHTESCRAFFLHEFRSRLNQFDHPGGVLLSATARNMRALARADLGTKACT